MPLPVPEPGLVIGYAYLRHAEYEQGQVEGIKHRPCAIVLTENIEDGDTVVTVVPITHAPPDHPEAAIELPSLTKHRLGLDEARSWIVVSEVNRFVWPGPDLRPVSRAEPDRFEYGLLRPSFFRKVRERLAAYAASRRLAAVRRTE